MRGGNISTHIVLPKGVAHPPAGGLQALRGRMLEVQQHFVTHLHLPDLYSVMGAVPITQAVPLRKHGLCVMLRIGGAASDTACGAVHQG